MHTPMTPSHKHSTKALKYTSLSSKNITWDQSSLHILKSAILWGFPVGLVVKNLPAMQEMRETQVRSLGGKIPWRRTWQSTPVFLPGESHGQRSLVSHSLWSHKGSETTVPPTPLLSPYGWCAYKERLGHRHTHRRKNRRQAKKRGFRRKSLADILTSDVQPPELWENRFWSWYLF